MHPKWVGSQEIVEDDDRELWQVNELLEDGSHGSETDEGSKSAVDINRRDTLKAGVGLLALTTGFSAANAQAGPDFRNIGYRELKENISEYQGDFVEVEAHVDFEGSSADTLRLGRAATNGFMSAEGSERDFDLYATADGDLIIDAETGGLANVEKAGEFDLGDYLGSGVDSAVNLENMEGVSDREYTFRGKVVEDDTGPFEDTGYTIELYEVKR